MWVFRIIFCIIIHLVILFRNVGKKLFLFGCFFYISLSLSPYFNLKNSNGRMFYPVYTSINLRLASFKYDKTYERRKYS